MPEGYPTLESQVPYYEAVKDQGAENTPSDPSRLAPRRIHYIESPSKKLPPSGEEVHQVRSSTASQERTSTWNHMLYAPLLDLYKRL